MPTLRAAARRCKRHLAGTAVHHYVAVRSPDDSHSEKGASCYHRKIRVSFIVRIATLYKRGSNPEAPTTPWVQVILRCDNLVDKNCVIEQHTGTAKMPSGPDVAEAASSGDIEAQFDEIVRWWEAKDFKLHKDHKPYPNLLKREV